MEQAAGFIDTWFLNNATAMTPNLEYSQVIRGVGGSGNGTHEGMVPHSQSHLHLHPIYVRLRL